MKFKEIVVDNEKGLVCKLLEDNVKLDNIGSSLEKDFVLALHKDYSDYVNGSCESLKEVCKINFNNFLNVFHLGSYMKSGGDLCNLVSAFKEMKQMYRNMLISNVKESAKLIELFIKNDDFFDELDITVSKLWENIEESDIKFKTLTEITSAAIFMHEGVYFTYANKAAEELSGYSSEELKNMNFWDVIHPDFRKQLKENGEARKAGKLSDTDRYEIKIITKRGKEKWIDLNVGSIMLYGKRMVLGIGSSISIRKKIQEDLAASEEQLRMLINAMPDIVCFKNEKRKWVEANNFTIDLFELDKDTYRGKSEEDFLQKDNFYSNAFKCCKASDNEVMELGKIVHCEEIVPRRDGTNKIFDIIKVPLYYEDGSSRGIIVLGRDITERKRAEWELRQSEERYRKLVELAPYGVYVGNRGKIIFANSAGTKLLGVQNSSDIMNKRIYELVNIESNEVEKVNSMVLNSKSDEVINFKESRFARKIDGKIINVEISTTQFPLKSNEDILVVVRDISEKKKAEDLKREVEENTKLLNETIEYDKLRTEFFANISHELRTPLNVILSTMQLIELIVNEKSIAENENKVIRYINVTKQNCNRLVRLVNNLIDITKIDAGFFKLKYQNEDIVRVVEDITLSVAEYIENKGITLQFDTDVEEKIIACDSQIIERIMLNLLSNAVKFTDVNGHIWVNMSDRGENIIISVKDTGIGIDEEKQDMIFDRFIQIDKSLSRSNEGSGIGLSLVKSLVEMHGGKVWLISEKGKGSEFIVELPCIRMEQESLDANIYSIISNIERINIEFSDIYI